MYSVQAFQFTKNQSEFYLFTLDRLSEVWRTVWLSVESECVTSCDEGPETCPGSHCLLQAPLSWPRWASFPVLAASRTDPPHRPSWVWHTVRVCVGGCLWLFISSWVLVVCAFQNICPFKSVVLNMGQHYSFSPMGHLATSRNSFGC